MPLDAAQQIDVSSGYAPPYKNARVNARTSANSCLEGSGFVALARRARRPSRHQIAVLAIRPSTGTYSAGAVCRFQSEAVPTLESLDRGRAPTVHPLVGASCRTGPERSCNRMSLDGALAAVDRDGLASEVRSALGGEQRHQAVHLLGVTHALHGDEAVHQVGVVVIVAGHELG